VLAAEPRLDCLSAEAATHLGQLSAAANSDRLRADVEAIARPRNRLNAAAEMERAETYAAEALAAAGWEVERHPFTITDVLGVPDHRVEDELHPRVHYERLDGANLLALKRGAVRGRPILVGAHLDTVRGSPGADDNGSGVASVLELARILAPLSFRRDVLLAIFDMEEIGCFGSRALVQELRARGEPAAAIVLESVGFVDRRPGSQIVPPRMGAVYRGQVRRIEQRGRRGDWSLVVFRRTSLALARMLGEALAHLEGREAVVLTRDPLDLPLLGTLLERLGLWTAEFGRSDHAEFWAEGVPAVQLTDTANFRNPNYHEPGDLPETLDYQRLAAVVAATALTVARVADVAAATARKGATMERLEATA
jgi:Peptidase family M28